MGPHMWDGVSLCRGHKSCEQAVNGPTHLGSCGGFPLHPAGPPTSWRMPWLSTAVMICSAPLSGKHTQPMNGPPSAPPHTQLLRVQCSECIALRSFTPPTAAYPTTPAHTAYSPNGCSAWGKVSGSASALWSGLNGTPHLEMCLHIWHMSPHIIWHMRPYIWLCTACDIAQDGSIACNLVVVADCCDV